MDKWTQDFNDAVVRLNSPYLRAIKPKIILMPAWWPVKADAWAYLNVVMIGPGILDAPNDVRRYVIGHELGHLYAKHTLLHLLYWFSAAGSIIGLLFPHLVLLAGTLSALVISAFFVLFKPFIRHRELHADAIAAQLYGREIALAGCLWMAQRSGTLHDPFRQSRLRNLGL